MSDLEVGEGNMRYPEQAVILCGGLGTRMRPYTNTVPKPMISCNGKPFLWYLLQQLREQGISYFVLLTGYLTKQIEAYFKDGSEWGWHIVYSQGSVEWETGRRIWEARGLIYERFMLLYSDNFVPFSLQKVLTLHEQNDLPLTLMAAHKSPGNIAIDSKKGIVLTYKNNRDSLLGFVEIGYMIVEKTRTLKFFESHECSFSSILRKMASKRQISAWIQGDSYHSISDPERWKKTEEYLKPHKILLIDRDGVINYKASRGEYITSWKEFKWISETRNALKKLAQEGFRFILISNQAGISRGMVDPGELERIHRKMKEELTLDSVEILGIYFCPHHWNDGCSCRKPKPGMIFQAANDHLLRLDYTYFLGDDSRDIEAAENAGCKGLLYKEGNWESILKTITKNTNQDTKENIKNFSNA